MSDTPTRIEINCATGAAVEVPLTAAEIAERDQFAAANAARNGLLEQNRNESQQREKEKRMKANTPLRKIRRREIHLYYMHRRRVNNKKRRKNEGMKAVESRKQKKKMLFISGYQESRQYRLFTVMTY
jgi:hypothetical protein